MTITLDASWIKDVSMDVYNVGIGGTIDNIRFARYLTIINSRLIKDNLLNTDGSLKTGYEYLAALLICDLIQKSPATDIGIKSEVFGDYSYSKTDAASNTTKSAFMINYENELAVRRPVKLASARVTRTDQNIEFAKLSQGDYPVIGGSDEL
jgi:hypothetical protein